MFLIEPGEDLSFTCEGYVFTGVCLSTGGVYPTACWDTPPRTRGRQPPEQTPMQGMLGYTPAQCMLGYTPMQCMLGYTPRPVHVGLVVGLRLFSVHAGIRSTSGRYASHWSAFLFGVELPLLPNVQECIPVGSLLVGRISQHGLLRGGGVCLSACWDTTPRCGPGDPPGQTPQPPPWVWAWRPPPARPLNLPPGCGPGNLQAMLGYTPPPLRRPARHAGIPPARHARKPSAPPWTESQTCIKT